MKIADKAAIFLTYLYKLVVLKGFIEKKHFILFYDKWFIVNNKSICGTRY